MPSFTNICNRDHIESEAKKAAADRYFTYAKEQLDCLTAGARNLYENQRVLSAPVEGTATEHDAALSLLSLSHGNSGSTESVQAELDSLRSLQESIGNRIQRLGVPRINEVQDDDEEVQDAQDTKATQHIQKVQDVQNSQEVEMGEGVQEDAQEV